MSMPVITSFYTPEYAETVKGLISTCEQFGLRTDIQPRGTLKNWFHNCAQKAQFCEEMFIKHGEFVWLDADARVRQRPVLFEQMVDYDFAAWFPPSLNGKYEDKILASGTLWFAKTDKAAELLAKWQDWCRENENRWDQKSLRGAWLELKETGLRTRKLPQTYCKVFDAPWRKDQKKGPVVIVHTQASRQLKLKVGWSREVALWNRRIDP